MDNTEQISKIYQEYFNIDTVDCTVRSEIITPSMGQEFFDRARKKYLENLETHPNRAATAKKLYVSDKYIIYIQAVYSNIHLRDLQPGSSFYYPICTLEEIKKIECPRSAWDILLRIRADSAVDHPRTIRAFLKRREIHGDGWSLSGHYNSNEFDRYINKLPPVMAQKCKSLPAGYIPSREPHGYCLNTEFGQLIALSEPLKHFLYFMCIHMFGSQYEISEEDKFSAFLIASRAMLLTETSDYDLDPRGQLPQEFLVFVEKITADQLQFIIGHEYAHALLGHHAPGAISEAPTYMFSSKVNVGKWYNPSQQQEFDADAGSLLHAKYNDYECAEILNAATAFFLQLELFYTVSDYINPCHNPCQSHPDPIDRIWALRKAVSEKRGLPEHAFSDAELHQTIDGVKKIKAALIEEYLPFEIEKFEGYGSMYLPNLRSTPLVDRFDY